MTESSRSKCPICGRECDGSDANRFRPFCSDRCRIIDLGNWLGGTYRLPGPPASDAEIASELRRREGDGRKLD